MAQVDTGLGWEAKQGWIEDDPKLLCTIKGPPQYELTNNITQYMNNPSNDQMLQCPFFYYQGYAAHCCVFTSGSAIWPENARNVFITFINGEPQRVFVSRTVETIPNGATNRIKVVDPNISLVNGTMNHNVTLDQDPTTGLYYWYGKITYGSTNPSDYTSGAIKVFATLADGLAAYSGVTKSYYKTANGKAAAALGMYFDGSGRIIKTPVLMSTSSDAVKMSSLGPTATPDAFVGSIQYDGLRFFVSYYRDSQGTVEVCNLNYALGGNTPINSTYKLAILVGLEINANVRAASTTDPYGDENSEEGGGDPEDPEDDDIDEEDLPDLSFASAGFCRIYRPSVSQLNSLANYMWTDNTFLDTVINHLKQIIENPIDSIISLSIVPCSPPVGSNVEVKVMYVPTGVYMPPVTKQFVTVDCGSVQLTEMYGSALDYNPYTSVQLYLPFIGTVQLDTDEVMGKTLKVSYNIDVVTGVCCAYVKAGPDVLYQFSGHCSIPQPITSADFSGYLNAALAAGKMVASIAAAGAGAPEVGAALVGAPSPSVSTTEKQTVDTVRNPNTGRQITAGTSTTRSERKNSGASFGEISTRAVANTVGSVMNSKTIIQHSGGFSGNSGYLAAVRRPYLIVTRPRIANPEEYGQFNGRPAMIYMNLGSCTGFTQVQSVHLTGLDATNQELSEISSLLMSGVIF